MPNRVLVLNNTIWLISHCWRMELSHSDQSFLLEVAICYSAESVSQKNTDKVVLPVLPQDIGEGNSMQIFQMSKSI